MRTIHPIVLGCLSLGACHSDSDSPAPTPAPLVANLGVAAERLIGQGDLRMVVVSEEERGVDLDGDGDTVDLVLDLLDLETGAVQHTGFALPPRFLRDELPPPQFGASDELAVFQVSETETGRDVDQDGTIEPAETWVFERRTGTLRGLSFVHGLLFLDGPLAVMGDRVFDARDGSLTQLSLVDAFPVAVKNDIVAFEVPELGAFDLNADGDTSDVAVLHLYDAPARVVRNVELEVFGFHVRLAGGFAGFAASEAANGALDLDGDGDANDVTFVAVGARSTHAVRVPGIDRGEFAELQDPELFVLSEPEGAIDGNGDGDLQDRILRVYDPARDRVVDIGLAFPAFGPITRTDGWLGHPVDEGDQGESDLDGDGALTGTALHVHDLQHGVSHNLAVSGWFLGALDRHLLASHFVFESGVLTRTEFLTWDVRAARLRRTTDDVRAVLGTTSDRALLLTHEKQDLNGDGDSEDLVLQVFHDGSGTLRNLGLAWGGGDAPFLGEDGRAALLVSEAAQGADLNADGDELDFVVHTLDLGG